MVIGGETLNYETYLESDYFEIACEEYKNFKGTNEHDEQYKYDILKELNKKISQMTISPSTVVDIVKIYQKSNPQYGSFVHWNNLSDLLNFAEEQPKKVTDLLNQLFDDSIPVNERIERFYKEGKAYNPKINLGTPLFGYLLAGYNYTKYPPYKDGVFTDLLNSLQIPEKPVNIFDKYNTFYDICHDIKSYLDKRHFNEFKILDAQDLIYSISQYAALKVKIAVCYIHQFAKKLYQFKKNINQFLDEIQSMDRKYLIEQRNNYKNTEKVNRIRFLVIVWILNDQPITLDNFHQIQQDVNKDYETNILQAWGDFTILFQIYYNQYKEKVKLELQKIHQEIREIDAFRESSFKKDKVINDFMWKNNFGSSDT